MFTLQIGTRTTNFLPDLAAVSAAYVQERDHGSIGKWAHGFRENRMPPGIVMAHGGEQIGYVSYNGRVWPGLDYEPSATPLHDNRIAA